MMELWQQLVGERYIQPLQVQAWRVVEAQHVLASRKLVDSAEEHEILEALIESVKPVMAPEWSDKRWHYLLLTPFRYPPLHYGSRFGSVLESSLWYGSLELPTAFAEVAFYRFLFISGSAAELTQPIEGWFSAFMAKIATSRGIQLNEKPFVEYKTQISSPSSYAVSQPLGSAMRQAEITAFTYQAARVQHSSLNVALFTPQAFARKTPVADSFQTWQCITDKITIDFVRRDVLNTCHYSFKLEQFTVNGALPFAKTITNSRL